jgi:hypothetical protein
VWKRYGKMLADLIAIESDEILTEEGVEGREREERR